MVFNQIMNITPELNFKKSSSKAQDQDIVVTANIHDYHSVIIPRTSNESITKHPRFSENNDDNSDNVIQQLKEKERQLYVMAQNLKIQQEYNEEMKEQLNKQMELHRQQREDVKMLETDMN